MFFNFLANLTFSKLHLEILSRMWQQSAVAHYAMCGAGGKLVLECIAVHRRLFTALFICMLSLCVLLRDNYTAMNRSHVRIYYNYAQMLLSQLPENAMLLVNDDMVQTPFKIAFLCSYPFSTFAITPFNPQYLFSLERNCAADNFLSDHPVLPLQWATIPSSKKINASKHRFSFPPLYFLFFYKKITILKHY